MEPQGQVPHPRPPAAPARNAAPHRSRSLALGGLTLANCALLALLISPGGPSLARIVSPRAGEVVGLEGVQVIVRVPDDGRADPESLRVLLNGADVTEDLTTGQNGAVGRLYGVLDGDNVLRIRIEASSWWFDGRPFEAGREVHFQARRPLDLDRG